MSKDRPLPKFNSIKIIFMIFVTHINFTIRRVKKTLVEITPHRISMLRNSPTAKQIIIHLVNYLECFIVRSLSSFWR